MPSTENPNAPDNFGQTPLMDAEQNGHQEIVNLLNAHNVTLPASQINQLDIASNDIPTKNMTQKFKIILFYVLFAIVLLCILAVFELF